MGELERGSGGVPLSRGQHEGGLPTERARLIAQATALLIQRRFEEAAALTLESGLAEPQKAVLRSAGWHLLFRRQRILLRALLDQRAGDVAEDDDSWLLEAAWQVEAASRPHHVEAELTARLPRLSGLARQRGLALSASVQWQYSHLQRASELATKALQAASDDLDPTAMLARSILGGCLFNQGDVTASSRVLKHALACATRDALPRAQLFIHFLLGMIAAASAEEGATLRAMRDGRRIAEESGIADAWQLDGLALLEASVALQALDAEGARNALARGIPAETSFGAPDSLPHRLQRAILALVEGDHAGLAAHVAWMEAELSHRFYSPIWRVASLVPRIAQRGRRADTEGLRRLVAAPKSEAPLDALSQERQTVLLAGASLLAGDPVDCNSLKDLARDAMEGNRMAVARQAELVIALAREDSSALLEHVRWSARHASRLDYLWLAPRAIGLLERLLQRRELNHDAITRDFLRQLVQRLLSFPSGDVALEPTGIAVVPGGLSAREWDILQLVGKQLTNEQIAAKLHVSLATVKTHINHIYRKLEIRSRTEAVLQARTLRGALNPQESISSTATKPR